MPEVIGAWLSIEEGEAFSKYCAQLGLDESALATLLLTRELSRGQLGVLNWPDGPRKLVERKRVTARSRAPGFRRAFIEHAKTHGFGQDKAACLIFLREIEEQWLQKAIANT